MELHEQSLPRTINGATQRKNNRQKNLKNINFKIKPNKMENKELQELTAAMREVLAGEVWDRQLAFLPQQCAQAALNHFNNRWVRVEDKLPEIYQDVLVWNERKKDVIVANMDEFGVWTHDSPFHSITTTIEVKFWQPKPQPPKE